MRTPPCRGLKGLAVLGLVSALAVPAVAPTAAQARVLVGVGIGVPVYTPPPPVYYYPPPAPVYYPPVVYTPPPVVVAPPPVVPPAAPPPAQTGYCRQYNGDATIDGKNQPFYGTACRQPDGRWHIVN